MEEGRGGIDAGCQGMMGSGKSGVRSWTRTLTEVATGREQLLCRLRQQGKKERGSQLYAARAVDVNIEEGAAARIHCPVRERPHRPTTLHTRYRVDQLRGLPTQLGQPLHTRYTYHGRPLGPDRLGH